MSPSLLLVASLAAAVPPVAPVCAVRSGAQSGALIELYTSEGCSSCPPADRWLAGVATMADPARLSVLAFHVDYWDELGWPDRFAQARFTARQRERVRAGGSTTIYTPQVMLSSRLDLRWYRPGEVAAAVRAVQQVPSALGLSLRAVPEGEGWRVQAGVHASGSPTTGDLYVALYENGLVTPVRGGENRGATLHHERVVRALWGPWRADGTRAWQVDVPKDAAPGALGLTAFVQRADSGQTLQALSLPLSGCIPRR